ncbi:hypothetical protein J23TS9_52570 [Paenibacillus sp. J23TS9]|uniref:hypothetical protein n=1 Tax=Paenibacillus sp. J23TS9 TaxID=2807193 RepID=UPI001AFFFB5C|nr:hypothetical protein [Paenibacillus sp. J23TS9]GIP30127.1 hypothetical protein J23TS9_52570 [Paenibacillus sp. J23TS9]
MNGSHQVVGVQGLILILALFIANYFIVYLIVSHVMKNSGLKLEIDHLKNEVKDLRELLNERLPDR